MTPLLAVVTSRVPFLGEFRDDLSLQPAQFDSDFGRGIPSGVRQ